MTTPASATAAPTTPDALQTETVRWNLSDLYSSDNAPELTADVNAAVAEMAAFSAAYQGQLATKLGAALTALAAMHRAHNRLYTYLDMRGALDSVDTNLRKVSSRAMEMLNSASATHMTFFDLEVVALPENVYQRLLSSDDVVRNHRSMLDHLRAQAKYFLSADVEQSLTLHAPYGPSEWSDLMEELEAGLRFDIDGTEMQLSAALKAASDNPDAAARARALEAINTGLIEQKQAFFAARTFNAVAGSYHTGLQQRGYTHPLQPKNISNQVDDATVDALHRVVEHTGGPLAQRFYQLKARLLGLDKLTWSDRNAPMPFADKAQISWPDAARIVTQAYHAFSPTLGALVEHVISSGWVDAPPAPTKRSGAFDATTTLADGDRSYVLLNYLGTSRDVATVAHEFGHAVHGLLAAEAQGPLMWSAPMVYAETASVFGEMLTFEHLLAQAPNDTARLALLMDKMNDFLNTVFRQIHLSTFEQAVHTRRPEGKLSADDLGTLWLEVTRRFYGPDARTDETGIFSYANAAALWCYISHFWGHAPFYVYAYAFGELFTQSLMATRPQLGSRFEPLYLDLLRAGGTKDAVALLKPFGLNPTTETFWHDGLTNSFGRWLTEAEELSQKLGLLRK